jgi:ADP-ribose pyrophosphatase
MKIPPEAKLVFKGIIFNVYQWEQKLYDGTTTTFEMLKRPDTVVMLALTPDNQVIMIDHEQPGKRSHADLPAGRVDKENDHLEAAKRELREETGYTSQNWKLWGAFQPVAKIDWTIYYYLAYDCEKTHDQELDGGEKITPFTISIDEFLDKVVSGEIKAHDLGLEILQYLARGEKEELVNRILNK